MEHRIELYWPTKGRVREPEYRLWVHPRKKDRVDKIPAGSLILFYETAKRPGNPNLTGAKRIFAAGVLTDRIPDKPKRFKDHRKRQWIESRIVKLTNWVPPKDGIDLSEIRQILHKKSQWNMRQGPYPISEEEARKLSELLAIIELRLTDARPSAGSIKHEGMLEDKTALRDTGSPAGSEFRNVAQKDEETSTRQQAEAWIEIGKVHNRLVNHFSVFCRNVLRIEPDEDRFDVLVRLPDQNGALLIEAKSSAEGTLGRHQIREAIGQLFDYRFIGWKGQEKTISLAVLLPKNTSEDIAELLQRLEIGLIWESHQTFFATEGVRRLCKAFGKFGEA